MSVTDSERVSRRRFIQAAGGMALALTPLAGAATAVAASMSEAELYEKLRVGVAAALTTTVPALTLQPTSPVDDAAVGLFAEYHSDLRTVAGKDPFSSTGTADDQLARLRALYDPQLSTDQNTLVGLRVNRLVEFLIGSTPGYDVDQRVSSSAALS